MTQLHHAAQMLGSAGWPIFPVDAKTKRPRTQHGHLDATTDALQITLWAHRFDYGGAIATPTGGGLLVVDVDPRNGGKVPAWCPPTRTVKTQLGGLHLHYGIDEDIKSRAGLFGRGVDAKSRGGYVLLPPSPGYEWVDLRPRAALMKAVIQSYMIPESRERNGAARVPPERWHRGIIHDQVVAWSSYFAGELDTEEDVEAATWEMVERARMAGVRIDNARGHIDSVIRWVLSREAATDAP